MRVLLLVEVLYVKRGETRAFEDKTRQGSREGYSVTASNFIVYYLLVREEGNDTFFFLLFLLFTPKKKREAKS